jgi:phospholipid-binding lipoprotein MlaA
VLAASVALAACAAPVPDAINDPHEADNRAIHEFNVAVDRAVLKPLAQAVGPGAQGPLGEAVSNVAMNLSMPSSALNKLLQGRVVDAVHNTVRFAVNSSVGLGGLFDPASALGLDPRKSDFGATLHTWGAAEGTYAELPFIGPSTSRDTLGMMVDLVIDPIGLILPSGTAEWALAAKYGSKLGDRARFSSTVDSILHESADSYAQTRLMYLQNRRFELGQEVADDEFIDPYE